MKHAVWLVVLVGCGPIYKRHDPVEPPDKPVPFAGINTQWDDYNASKPPGLDTIIYSTNRGSEGKDLDVWTVGVRLDVVPKVLGEPRPVEPALMSSADERGPLHESIATFEMRERGGGALAFSSARDGGAGGLDLYWAETDPPVVHRLEHLSSTANDAYLTHVFGESTKHRALFASDRGGSGYDIYEAQWDGYQIGGPPLFVRRVEALSSTADDSAPFIASQTYTTTDVVFASKRDGGLGGWDLYCSHFDGTSWSTPRPIGNANTEHDEFRPSIADDRRFLIFSSNRPGGAGGYDLYTVRFTSCAQSM